MAKYKLIKTYPGSPELGTIASRGVGIKFEHPNGNVSGFSSSKCKDFESLIENQPEFWEEVVEKEYEILSFKGRKGTKIENSIFTNKNEFHLYFDEWHLENIQIHSVKRLSDGEVFTIGDKIKLHQIATPVRIIKKIHRLDDSIIFEHDTGSTSLKSSVKIKQPIFTAEDGVDIYEGDRYYYINRSLKGNVYDNIAVKGKSRLESDQREYLYFSTKKAAEEYILYNKPCLSINDLINKSTHRVLIEELKNIVRSKLHESKN